MIRSPPNKQPDYCSEHEGKIVCAIQGVNMKGKLSRLVMAGLVMVSVGLPLTGFGQVVEITGLAGPFSLRASGSLAVCLNPTTLATEGCTTSDVLIYPLTIVENGTINRDSEGNICETDTNATSALPPNAQPSSSATSYTVGKLTDYDPTLGQGDYSITGYSGGKCVGSSFDSSGATETGTGTVHIVVTSPDRVDIVLTSYTAAPVSDVESFSLSGYELRRK
jgi:hypothetical protein